MKVESAHDVRSGGIDSRHAVRRRFAIEGLEARVMLAAGGVEQLAAPWSPAGRFLHKDSGFLSAPSRKAPLSVALAYLSAHAADLGLMAADVANPFVTDQYTDADTGVTHLYFRQRVNHIAVANANLNVNVARDGRVLSVGGGFVGGASTSPRGARAVARAAAVTAAGAVDSIFKLLPGGRKAGSRVDAVRGRDLATFNAPELSLDPIAPAMHYVAVAGGGLKLAWNLAVRTPDRAHWYDLNVDAATGAGLSRTDWVSHATYNVYPLPVESPDDGTRAALTDPHDPVASPYGWHDTNGVAGAEFTDTRGNNVSAQDDIDANNSGGTRPDGGAALNFDFPLVLTGAPSTYRPAATTQMFYVNNALHDIHSRYGFTESAGNFQVTNYGGQGAGNDAVQADAQDGSGTNNANFATPPDGTAPRMQMYLFNYTSPGRDGDLDTQIVIHEYGHGVSNRLTGGPANSNALNATQSGGMGEGWSDWWGLMLTQKASDLKAGRYPVGTYVLGHNATTGAGIRRYPYSFDMAVDPLTIAAYNSDPSKEVHNTGEIWSTVLWDLNWLLIDKYGFSPTVAAGYDPAVAGKNGGNNLALQLVTDALKLQPANPSFKDARDAILQADQVRTGGANRFQIWTAFARRGMGYSFVNTSSSGSTVTPATDLPPDLLKPRVVGHVPTAPQTAPLAAVDLNFSEAMNPASFAIADDLAAFTGPGGTDLLGQVTGFTWLNGNSTLRLSFSPQSVNGRYAITVGPQILAADDGTALDQDADGTAGEATADQYTATIGFDALPLAVTAASPASGTTVAPPVTFIELSFNEAVDPASIGTGDLSLSQGSVTGATLVDPTTVRYTLSGVTTEGALTYTLAAGAVTDADGFASAAFTGNLAVDIGTRALPAPTAIAPAASLAYRATGGGVIGVAADVDDFTLPLDAGQTVTVVVTPAAGLRAAVTLTGPGGAALGAATATAAGLPVVLRGLPVATAGLYTVGVAGVAGTGAYTVEVLLNADVAREDVAGGTTDDTFATAQPVAVAGTPLGASGGSVTTVLGKLPTPTGSPIVSEGFESGSLGPAWTTYSSSSQGRIRVSAAQTPQAGANALFMDVDDSAGTSYVLNEAVWTVNLAGATSPTLSFYATTFSDDSDALPTTFTGHYDGDGVSISADGVTWYTVWTNTYPSSWTNVSINLAAAAQAAGLTLGANFKVKFQQYDNFSITTDGFGWDSVAVTVPAAAQDNYAITAAAGQWLSIAAARTAGAGTPVVTVYDAAGMPLATGVAPSGSATSGIHSLVDQFLVPADGTYYVRVSGNSADYALVVARDAALESEPNDAPAAAHDISGPRVAAGAIGAGPVGPVQSDGFETGTLGPAWSTYSSSATGRIRATNLYAAAGGAYALMMDTTSGGGTYDLNEAVWTVDLTGKTAATLAWADTLFSDESDFLPATFTGHYAGDGVAVSGDGGTTWVTISNAPGGTSGGWVTRSVDLAATALAAGWALGPSFKIKFQQYDNYDITTDGRGYDNITLSAPLPSDDHYSLRATAGQALRVTTATPGADPAGEFANALDPVIDLYDPSGALVATDDNSAPDGRNALIDFVATAAGVYTVRVRAANNTRGEYVLDAHQYSLAGGVTDQPDLLAASDTGVSGTDNVTRLDNATPGQAPRFLVPGTAPGATVTLYADGIAVASAVATGYSTVLTLDGASRLTDGPHVFVARQTPAGGTASADSAPLTLTVVTTPSTAPTAPVLRAASDSGLSASDGVTNDATPTFDVTPGGAPYLRLYRNGVAVADFLPAGDAVTLPGQPDGTFTFAFSAVDVAGNESPVGPASAPLTIDTAAPAAPVAPDLQASSDTGFSTSDNVTGVSAPVFDLGTPAGAYFRVYRAGVLVSPGYGAGPSFAAPAQSDGTALWTSSYVDLAGNESLASPAVTVGIDTVAPATPPALDLQAASDGGGSDTDNVTNDATPTFDVAGAAPYFRVYKDGVLLSGTYATGTTYTPSALANGTYVFTVVAVDAAGNASGASAPISVTVDTSILSAPALSAASDTGILTTDRLTRLNNATPATALDFVVPGTAAGATVTLYADGVAIGSAVSAAGGTITVRTDGVTVIPDGARAITFRQILPGESESADSGFVAVTVDSVAPVAPAGPDMLDANDTGFSATDNVTTNKTPGFTVAPGAGAYYRLFVDGVQRGADYQTGTVTLGTTADGTYAATAFAIDAAGNVSPLSAATSFTIDTVAPAAPTLAPDLQDASDTGVSNADNVTRILTPTFDIPGAGGTDTYFRVYSAGSLISGSYQSGTTYTAGTQFNGTFAHTVALVDAAGNVSAQGPGLTVTFDSFAPGFPSALDLQAASDTGLSSTDNNTRQTNPTFNVSVSAGNYFRVYRAGTLVSGSYETGTTFTTAVTDGTYAFTNTAVDAAGNESSVSSSLSLTIDTVAPSAPSAPDMTVSTDSGFSTSDNVTANATPGFTVAGTTYYRLLVDGAQLTGDYQTGTFTLPAQSDGTYAATASAVDLAGNASAPSTATGFTIDRVAPAAPTTAPNLQAASDSGVSATDDLTRINVPTFDVPGVAAADYFRVYRNGTLISGNFQAGATYTTGSTQSTGTFAYTYAVADAAGNVSTQGPGLSVTYDTTAPSAPGALDLQDASDTGSLATDNVTNDNTPTFTVPGTAIPYYRVYRFGTLLSPGYETASTFTAPTTADGTYQFWAVAVDAAGNESAPGTVLSVTVDTVAPAAPTAPDLRATSDTGSSATDNLTNAMYPAFDLAHAGAGSLRFTLDGVAGHRVSTTGAGTYTLTAGPVAFAAENRATNGVQATRIWTADFNRDGRPDLVSGGYTSSLNVFLGNGTGGFSSNFTIALYAAASGFRVADLNHDSNPDLVVANGTNGTISIILGRGDGTFMPQTLLPVGETAGDVVVADFDGDTHPDVVTTTAADSLRFYRGVGDGTFAPAVATSFVRAGLLRAVDTDADGRPELMIASTALPELSTLKLRADGTVESGTTNTLASPATGFEVADFNGDGRPDFVTVGSNGSTLLTRQADGTMLRQIATIAGGLSSVTVADFNLDGAPDVAWGSSAASARTITVRLNRGDGTFHPDLSITTAYPTSGLTGADLTGDGRPDLALVTTSSSALGLLASAPAYPLGDGLHTLTSQLSDLAGNASPESAPLTFTIDRVAPTTNVPAVVTADQDPRLDGTVDDPSATVLVAWYPSLTYPTTVNPNGTWTLPDNTFQVPISFGVHEVTTISTDLAGNSRTQRFAGALTIALTTPVMVTEPAFTAGTANTVSWAAMPGVDAYFVQADTDPTFASPDASSGWITGTSHQFTGLTGGARYYYRVQALKTVEAGYEAVQESRQTYLAGTSGVGVTATWAPGQVVLAHTPTSNVSDDFEGGTYAGWAAGSGAYTRQVTTATAASGAYSLYLGGGAQGYFDGLTRGLPNSVPNLIKFRVRAGTTDAQQGYFIPTWNNGGYHPFYFVLEDDGTMAFVADGIAYRSPYVANQWYEVAINIDWTSRTMAFAVDGVVEHGSVPFPGATGAMTGLNIFNFSANSAVWFDAIEFFNKGTYSPSGTLTSVAITPPAATFRHWGAVTYTKVTPAGTALTVDILDAAGNVLATNVASGTNLRLLGITAPALRLRANLSTASPSTVTPALQGWSLEYALAEGEQLSAWSAAVSSTQDANGPTVSLDNNQFITTPSPGFSGRIDDPAATVVVSIAGNTFAATNRGDGTWVLPAGTIPALTDGRYGVAVTATDPAGNRAAAGDTSWVVLTAPALVSWRVNGGAAQRSSVSSITLTFTTPVTPTDLAAIVLRRRSDGAPIDIEVTNPSNDEMNYLVTILPGPPFPRPQLVDGIYDLTLRHASIKDALNRAMAGPDTVLTFHRLAGDADGNGEVGLNDLVILSNNYGSTGGLPWSPGDFDGNGEVGLNDLVILSNMYGTKLALTDDPAPAAFAGGASVGPLADVSEPTSSDPLPHDEPIAPAVESPSAEQQQGTNTAMVAVTPLPATVPVTTETEEPLPAAQAPAVFEPTPAADPERTAAPMPAPARPFASTPARAVQSPVWTATPVAPKAATPVRPAAISAEFALTPPVPAKSGARSTPGRAAVPSARAAVASPFAAPRPPTSAKPRVTPAPTKGATVVASASTVAPLADAVPRIVGATAFHVRKRVPAVWEA